MSAELSQSPSTRGGGPLSPLSAADIDAAAKRIA
ncbi:MAG: threonine dehydratase, partial [Mycobacterium sp.]